MTRLLFLAAALCLSAIPTLTAADPPPPLEGEIERVVKNKAGELIQIVQGGPGAYYVTGLSKDTKVFKDGKPAKLTDLKAGMNARVYRGTPSGNAVKVEIDSCSAVIFLADPIPPCGCGCMTAGQCKCKNCAERTADPNYGKATPADPWARPDGMKGVAPNAPPVRIDDRVKKVEGDLEQLRQRMDRLEGKRAVMPAAAPGRYLVNGFWYVDHPTRPGWVMLESQAAPGVAAVAPFGQGVTTPATSVRPAAPASTSSPGPRGAGVTYTPAPGAGPFGSTSYYGPPTASVGQYLQSGGGCANGSCGAVQPSRQGIFGRRW